jgi:glutamate racemase
VLRDIRTALPAESIHYVADSVHAPWGDKPVEYVRRRGLEIADFLVEQGAKAIVIGSNTGTAASAEALRAKLRVPVVAMEPGIKPAAAATQSGVVGVIVTAAMSASDRMASLLDRFGRNVRVISASRRPTSTGPSCEVSSSATSGRCSTRAPTRSCWGRRITSSCAL